MEISLLVLQDQPQRQIKSILMSMFLLEQIALYCMVKQVWRMDLIMER